MSTMPNEKINLLYQLQKTEIKQKIFQYLQKKVAVPIRFGNFNYNIPSKELLGG